MRGIKTGAGGAFFTRAEHVGTLPVAWSGAGWTASSRAVGPVVCGQLARADPRITSQKSVRWKCGSLSASTSSFTVPKVLSGRCFIPWSKASMMFFLKLAPRG